MLTIPLIIAGLLVGVMLGLTGGGGSLLSVPALIYLAGLSVKDAVANSLAIVTITSFVALLLMAKRKNIDWRVGLIFSIISILGAYLGAKLAVLVPDLLILMLFYSVMLMSGFSMIEKAMSKTQIMKAPRVSVLKLASLGVGLGAFTGLVGAGGGFLVVPVLIIYAGLGVKIAIGTSLLVVSFKSLAAFIGYSSHAVIDYSLISYLTALAALGAMAGVLIGSRISESKLQLLFGLTIFISAMVLAAYEVTVWLDEIYSVSAYVSTSILLLFYALIVLALRERISKA
jgi:uncharacterized membrane protein YfcA